MLYLKPKNISYNITCARAVGCKGKTKKANAGVGTWWFCKECEYMVCPLCAWQTDETPPPEYKAPEEDEDAQSEVVSNMGSLAIEMAEYEYSGNETPIPGTV